IAHPMEGDVLICSDHSRATQAVVELVRLVPGLRPLDAGSLAAASPIEAMTAVILSLNLRYKTRAALRMTGIDVPGDPSVASPGVSLA
ncbi:MAG: NADPH-dependent F420 reductase, partial [Acidimicrobiales bacterium]